MRAKRWLDRRGGEPIGVDKREIVERDVTEVLWLRFAGTNGGVEASVRGWSNRRIARELELDRETVSRYVRLGSGSKPATLPAGIAPEGGSKPAGVPAGIGGDAGSNPAGVPAGISGSSCRPHHAVVEQGIRAGLSAQRLYQDLRSDHGFAGGYDAVKRYVRRLTAGGERRVERVECAPGEQCRFLHHAHIIHITGRSYRLKDRAAANNALDSDPK